ncbi:hypothetical protein BCR39DRAFT_558993 [Naematelia encephala]|uniref:Ribosomal protein S21 n=1 Tax=Naematelia encephala TaxID=71784 RepID=A0A1Y2B499_9TREE|nr:hypothetical protein BCR39DRAFT_558993 [Naematelia encephala]
MSILVGTAFRAVFRAPLGFASIRFNTTDSTASTSSLNPSTSSSNPSPSSTGTGTSTSSTRSAETNTSTPTTSTTRTSSGRIWPNIRINLPSEALELVKPSNPRTEAWWQAASNARQSGKVGNTYSGRTVPVRRATDVAKEFKNLHFLMRRAGIPRLLRNEEYYEKPSDKRNRLVSERHRRRFAALVRTKVHQVQLLKNRAR